MVTPDLGCGSCRDAALRAELPEVGQSLERHVIVRRCPVCSTYWIETDRSAYPVTAAEVAQEAPDVALHG